ncbi:hypothetical protein ACF1BS_04340 [Streptomyces sp. NPDC014748]|uniref:hypothetical protein n=1 Tax=Streptomyces sp. NPDC014748 TaxID=3364905 RepID=UPI0036FCC7B9
MASGPQHYRNAERLAEQARRFATGDPAAAAALAAVAQVHATLASVAVTAVSAPVDGAEPGMTPTEWRAWVKATAAEPADGGTADE